jgi:hypothetical protein
MLVMLLLLPAEAEKFLLSESALDDIDLTDDQYVLASNKNNKEIDFDALLEARMLDEVRLARKFLARTFYTQLLHTICTVWVVRLPNLGLARLTIL